MIYTSIKNIEVPNLVQYSTSSRYEVHPDLLKLVSEQVKIDKSTSLQFKVLYDCQSLETN